jgi:hypothetical protein
MTLIPKLIMCPTAVYVSTLLFPSAIRYNSFLQILSVGIVLGVIAYFLETFMLTRFSNTTNTFVDGIGSFLIVFLSGYILSNAYVTFTGAVVTAFILAFTEYVQHFIYKARV